MVSLFITQGKNEQKDGGEQQSFRSVQDLKAAGINLKPSKTCSVRDIKFSSLGFAAQLELPPLVVDDSMAPKFLNLIAYKMCPDNIETKYEITSYISFLDSLIDYPNDVKELRSANIPYNRLGCDDEVAQLFNEIAKDLVPNVEYSLDSVGFSGCGSSSRFDRDSNLVHHLSSRQPAWGDPRSRDMNDSDKRPWREQSNGRSMEIAGNTTKASK
ncbi:hypothetical protein TIFTF001_024619 [Ficus carica]|uniref:Uncharacterized protein n=1 Tax=Ficus carica TaxID=3494 RepID=A0AA88DDF8_FICCA|nr:hypothetical protein TIFTF001_024619 [Ficus carica]